MKKTIIIKLVALILTLATSSVAMEPTLILNYDINKTVRDRDAAAGKSRFDVLNTLVSMKMMAQWSDDSAEMSRYDYLKSLENAAVGKAAKDALKSNRNNELKNFVNLYGARFPGAQKYLDTLTVSSETQPEIFDSFFESINYLDSKNIPYRIVFRSFGTEVDEVAGLVEQWASAKKSAPVKFLRAVFIGDSLYLNPVLQMDPKTKRNAFVPGPGSQEIRNPADIQKILTETEYLAIQDEHGPWNAAGEDWEFGKKFFFPTVDSEGKPLLPLFFDDNIEGPGSPTNIVCPVRVFSNKMYKTDPSGLFDTQLFKVDTYSAIVEKHYFVNLIREALRAAAHRKMRAQSIAAEYSKVRCSFCGF